MSIIIDTNRLSVFFNKSKSDHKELRSILLSDSKGTKKCVWAIGGTKYRDEIRKLPSLIPIIALLNKSNKIKSYSDVEVNRLSDQYDKELTLKSNDSHIIALCVVSQANFLVTHDDNLIYDIKNLRNGTKIVKDDRCIATIKSAYR